jgi:hypothetical protein
MREYMNDDEMRRLENAEDPQVQRLASVVRGLSQELLLRFMREMGAKYLSNDDAPGLDIALWKAVIEAPVRLSDEEAAQLEQLSQQAGGWWKLLPNEEPEFSPLMAWEVHYEDVSKVAL